MEHIYALVGVVDDKDLFQRRDRNQEGGGKDNSSSSSKNNKNSKSQKEKNQKNEERETNPTTKEGQTDEKEKSNDITTDKEHTSIPRDAVDKTEIEKDSNKNDNNSNIAEETNQNQISRRGKKKEEYHNKLRQIPITKFTTEQWKRALRYV